MPNEAIITTEGSNFCAARERIEEKEELKSELSVQSVGDNHSEGVTSVSSVSSVRENWNKRGQGQACLDYAERRQFLERSEKKYP